MVDMGQAERSLYRRQNLPVYQVSRLQALNRAAAEFGVAHWMDIPDQQNEQFMQRVRAIQTGS